MAIRHCARILPGLTTTTVLARIWHEQGAAHDVGERAVMVALAVIASGTRGELKASVGAGGVRVRLSDPGQRDEAQVVLTTVLGAPVRPDGDPAGLRAQVPSDKPGQSTSIAVEALSHLARAGIMVSDFSYGQPSLDEVFLALTGSTAELTEATA